jgi:hypothetical protein
VSGWTQVNAPTVNLVSYTNSGLSASTTYYYRLRAWNASGDGAWSAVVSAVTSSTGLVDHMFGPAAAQAIPDCFITVYDTQGRVIMVGNRFMAHQKLSPGVYFVKTAAGVQKMFLLD